MDISGPEGLEQQRVYIQRFNYIVLGKVSASFVLLAVVCWLQKAEQPRIWLMLMVALGALGIGALAGFLFSTFGDEKERFSQSLTVLNGFIGGFAIADLSKADSVVRRFFQGLASSLGLPGCGGIVLLVVAAFGAMGFLALYVNKKVLLNPITSLSNKLADALTKATKDLLSETGISTTEPGKKPQLTDPKTTKAVETILGAPKPGEDASPESLKAYAKALYLSGDLSKASDELQSLLRKTPNDIDALLYKAQVLISDDEPLKAVPFLEKLAALPKAPILTWKLLGYAYLFDETRLEDALGATERYLQVRPDDAGALLNLACVYGQRGPKDEEAQRELPKLLEKLFHADPGSRSRVLELTKPNEDFYSWRDEDVFRQLVESPSRTP